MISEKVMENLKTINTEDREELSDNGTEKRRFRL